MAAVRHFEFAEIAVLVTWPISACDPSSLFQISRWSAIMAPRYSQKRFLIWRPSAILNLHNVDFLLNVHHGNWDVHLLAKFDQNETLHGGWAAVCSYTCKVWSKSVKGLRRCGGSKMALSYYFGQSLIQQLVLPYKPWYNCSAKVTGCHRNKHAVVVRKRFIIDGSEGSFVSPGKTWHQTRRSGGDANKTIYQQSSSYTVGHVVKIQ